MKMAHLIQNTLHTGLRLGDNLCYEQLLEETSMSRVLLNHYKASAELGEQEENGTNRKEMTVDESHFGSIKSSALHIRAGW